MSTSDAPNLRRLARQLADYGRRLRHLETVPQLSNSSLDDHGMPVYDADGNLSVTLGKQEDGTYSARPVAGPTPPAPVGLDAEGDAGLIHASWQGVFWAGAAMPRDFEAVEVLVDGNVHGAIHDPDGGSVTVPAFAGERVVSFRTLSQAGRRSDATGHVTVTVQSKASVQLDEARGRIEDAEGALTQTGERLEAAEQTVEGVRGDLTTLETVTLPGAVANLESADQANAQAVVDAETRADQARADLAEQIDQDIADAATALSSDIDSVRTSVDGKSKITQSVDAPPTTYDGAVGDRWERMSSMGSGGRLVSNWRWNGTTWVSTIIDGAVLSNVDASTISAGFLDSARIKAGSIYADKIVSGLSQNMVPDPGFVNDELNDARVSRASGFGGDFSIADGVITLDATGGLSGRPNISMALGADVLAWPAYPNMRVIAKAEMRAATGSASARWTIRFSRRGGGSAYQAMSPAAYVPLGPEWAEVAAEYALPGDATGYSVSIQFGQESNGVAEIRAPFAASSIGTVVIENGAVTTDKVAANAITAGKIAAGSIEADKIAAGAITVGKVGGLQGALDAKETPSGAQAKADAAKAAAQTAAEAAAAAEYGETKTLVGGWRETGQTTIAGGAISTDSITSGHLKAGAVTTEKLTVTGDMSAAIVNAMSVNTKKLVVSEEAILNHATLIGQTVVDDINVQGKLIGTDGVFTGTVDFENVNVTGLQLVEKLEANSISADKIEGGAFTGETFTGGTFTGGLFKTSDTLPGQVEFADNAYMPSWGTMGQTYPGLRVNPIDASTTSVPAGIGSYGDGVIVDGGKATTGRSSYIVSNPRASYMRTFHEGGATAGTIQTSPTASLMRTYREDGATAGEIATSATASLMRTYREDGATGGQVEVDAVSSRMRTYSGNSTESGWIQARPQDVELAYIAPNNTYFSRIKADANEASLFTRAGGANRYLSVDANGVWVKTNKSGSWKHYNLEETAQDSGWNNFSVSSGITLVQQTAWRNKGGIIWLTGSVRADWAVGAWTTIATLPAELRPSRDIRATAPIDGRPTHLLEINTAGALRLYRPPNDSGGAWNVQVSTLMWPTG